ncbi:uncharacterized protein I206_103608 [Kwoniella pini CBS 10737]|uniref:Uncharacterized protein n=1 Tax=Kwoniella pini CBS 10737 TaxID=1296096 RepID=A0A1B9I9D8_9TREE|nr:uncharacterized protein I206_01389 [Kwoniella pini CBS 10737]OCF52104.1 hypothetical protein I206_01389 [Kwoniella pini CBS 10737]
MESNEEAPHDIHAFFDSLFTSPSTSQKVRPLPTPSKKHPLSSSPVRPVNSFGSSPKTASSSPGQPSIRLSQQAESSMSLNLIPNSKRPLSLIITSASSSTNLLDSERPTKKMMPNFYRDSSIRGIIQPSNNKVKNKDKSLEGLLKSSQPSQKPRSEITQSIVPKPNPMLTQRYKQKQAKLVSTPKAKAVISKKAPKSSKAETSIIPPPPTDELIRITMENYKEIFPPHQLNSRNPYYVHLFLKGDIVVPKSRIHSIVNSPALPSCSESASTPVSQSPISNKSTPNLAMALEQQKRDNELLRQSLHSLQAKFMEKNRLLTKERISHGRNCQLLGGAQRELLSNKEHIAMLTKAVHEAREQALFSARNNWGEHYRRASEELRNTKAQLRAVRKGNKIWIEHVTNCKVDRERIVELANKAKADIESLKRLRDENKVLKETNRNLMIRSEELAHFRKMINKEVEVNDEQARGE